MQPRLEAEERLAGMQVQTSTNERVIEEGDRARLIDALERQVEGVRKRPADQEKIRRMGIPMALQGSSEGQG